MLRQTLLTTTLACRSLSTTARGSLKVRDVLDEKRSFRAGEDLKAYLRKQLDLSTIEQGSSVADVLDKMIRGETAVLVVLDKNKALAGLVTDRDYIRLAAARNSGSKAKPDSQTLVDDIMTPKAKVVAVTNSDTVEHCMELMVNTQVRHLPVLHHGKLHGIIGVSDFLHAPSRFEPEARRAIFAEEGVNIVSDDYSFSLTDIESDKIKADLARRVAAVKNRDV